MRCAAKWFYLRCSPDKRGQKYRISWNKCSTALGRNLIPRMVELLHFHSENTDKTINLGKRLGKALSEGSIVSLEGRLGAGKTTLVKGIGKAVGVEEEITSPSFTIVTVYEGRVPLYHIDLYRIERSEELDYLGLDEFLDAKGISVVEWGERAVHLFPNDYIRVSISLVGNNARDIAIHGITF